MWSPGDVVDEFRIEELLGEGGSCLVYRAVDEELGRAVALKVAQRAGVDADDLARRQARLTREARALARVQSSRVARVHGLRRVDGAGVVVVLEFVAGTTLAKLLSRQRQLSVERALQLGQQIAAGVQAIHDVGLVHRDLKPHNVMVDVVDGGEHVKVIDLGIARAASSSGRNDAGLTRADDIVGTLGFMAPEQILQHDVDAAADVWAFGAVLYRMLCGAPVFAATTLPALIRATVDGVARSLRERVPHHRVPAVVDDLVLQCLHKDPAARPAMAEVAYRLASLDGAVDDVTGRADRTRRVAVPLASSAELTPTLESPPSSKRSRSALPSASASLIAVRNPALPRSVTMFGVSIHEEPTLSGA